VKISKLEGVAENLQSKLVTQTKDYEGMLAVLDLKLEEKIRGIERSHETDMKLIKRLLMASEAQGQPEESKQGYNGQPNNNPLRASKPQHKVPPINIGGNQVQDIEQDNQQVSQAQATHPPSSRRSIQRQSSRAQQRAGHTEMDEIVSEENDEFAPFLSSTENEYTDLNTDFNTDRLGDDGPQSTYRRLNSRRSG
jgi:hypothetical protein